MPFWIQAGNPRFDTAPGVTVEDLGAAIQRITPFETEDMIMVWNAAPLRLEYKYDVYVVISGILLMLEALTANASGSHRALFGSDTFCGQWDLNWSNDVVRIQPTWQSLCGQMHLHPPVREPLSLDIKAFMAEWKLPLRIIADAVAASQIKMEDDSDYQLLRRIEPAITHFGRLYSHLGPTVPQ